MTGHHIYTRSWYEYGSRSKNPGTYTVEITDGLFGQATHDIIYNKLNPMFAQTQPSLAGYKPEESMLRIFHPTASSTMVSRSYFTNDEITKRGVVQYSFGLAFTDREKELFLQRPQRAFSLYSYELYSEFVKRVPEEGELLYSDKFDPKMEDYRDDFKISQEKFYGLGFTEDIFTKYFIMLGRIVSNTKNNNKLAALLPEGNNSEDLILSTLCMLPHWLRRKFGAVSKCSGTLDIGGIQLLCYVGERPPYDTLNTVIDLTGSNAHKNIGDISIQEEIFAKWIWQNIESPEKLYEMTKYMMTTYKQLIDRMPFEISAKCFWLWHTFADDSNAKKHVNFETASLAISSLIAAFGGKFNEYFSDKDLLSVIFSTFNEGFPNARHIDHNTVRALCTFAIANFEIDNIKAKDFIKPLFTKFVEAEEFERLEPLMSYYTKFLRDERPIDVVIEAIQLFSELTSCKVKKYADEAALQLGTYASASAVAKLKGLESERRFALFKRIVDLFKKQGRQFFLNYASFEELPKNEQFSVDFFEIEKAVRDSFNKNPPGEKHLVFVEQCLSWLNAGEKTEAMRELLNIYWNSEELHEDEERKKYIEYLFNANVLGIYVRHDIGLDYIRDIILNKFNTQAADLQKSPPNTKIEVLTEWLVVFTKKCGFAYSDQIFDIYYNTVFHTLTDDLGNILSSVSPKAMEDMLKLLERYGMYDTDQDQLIKILKLLCRIDENGKSDMNFSVTYNEWHGAFDYVAQRIEYWIGRTSRPSVDWAMSMAVCEMYLNNLWSNNHIIDFFKRFYKRPRDYSSELISMYEAIRYLSENKSFDDRIHQTLWNAIEGYIEILMQRLRNESNAEIIMSSAEEFSKLYLRPRNRYQIEVLGDNIIRHIRYICKSSNTPIPFSVLQRFNPNVKRAGRAQRTSKSENTALFISERFVHVIFIISAIALLISGVETLISLPFLVAGGVSSLLTLLLVFIRIWD